MTPCPTCLRPLATEADEALALPEGSHLCWKEWGGVCEPPEWWESVTPLEVQTLRAEIDELRLTLAAEQGKPEGAPSEGWRWDGKRWLRSGAVVEFDEPGSWPWRCFDGVGLGVETSARAAMIAADNAINPPSSK